jgi:hypothetical protein
MLPVRLQGSGRVTPFVAPCRQLQVLLRPVHQQNKPSPESISNNDGAGYSMQRNFYATAAAATQ